MAERCLILGSGLQRKPEEGVGGTGSPGLIASGFSSLALELCVGMKLAILDGCDVVPEPCGSLLIGSQCILLEVYRSALRVQGHKRRWPAAQAGRHQCFGLQGLLEKSQPTFGSEN